ncbi:host specificity protein J [Pseudomonas sp. MYb2]|uniref:phage tail tip fiber protein n=1 Tax=unclassified Pseudomonas TaxID=196821 RepID=UPI000CFEB70A|nr:MULTISPECIES: DUF1983 domain-containing protein [unclassified Pseudomonas]PRB51161.1 host specificity protein J [Pseudomonas sp. MYb3]PRC34540.1 host specificity protein J [Pseudomonas sp. MYb2]
MSGGVRKIASVVVGAVVGFAQGGPWGAVAGAALAFYASEQQEKLNTKSSLRDNEPSAQTVRSSKAPVRFILGRVSTGGVLVWAQEQPGAQGEGEWLHLVYVLSEGPIAALENIYLGEEEIGSYGAQATYELVVNPTQVNAFLKANCPDWKDSQIGRGLSFVRVSLQYSAEKFPSGIPDTRFVVRGRNDVYDPRTGTAVYSANTALHLLWFLRARCGVPDDEIVFETFASAANVCDEALTNADGSTSQRYRSGCVIGADEQRTGVLQKLEAACGGHLIRVGGRWMLQAGAYYGPYDFEITEDMVIGTVTGSTEPTNDSAINTVRGTFIDPLQSWTETDYPEVSVAEWIVEDGGEAAETLTYSYVTDPYQAQRLANMELRRRRAGGAISIPMNFAGYNCRPGRVVRVNLPSLNILGEFIVSDWSMGDSEGCNVQVKQYEAAIFDDAVGQPYNPIGFINLPAGGLGTPSALTWTQDTTAEVTQGVLSWLPPTGIVKEYIVIVRQGYNAIQSHNVPATSTEIAINGLPSGNYTMSVAAVGPMARSGEATITVSINGPPIPESCVVQSSIDNIVLIPSNSQNGLNGGTYEYFFSTSPTATSADAEYLGQGLTFTHTGLGFWTNYYYFIRSSNAYGKSSFLYVPAQTSNDVSAYLAAMAGKVGRTELGQDIVDEIDKIPGLQDQIDALDGLKGYEPDQVYLKGQMIVESGQIYMALQPVPVNTPPPNPLYWEDVGDLLETASGLAEQVSTHTTEITELDGEVTATSSAFNALRASWRDDDGLGDLDGALKEWGSTAAIAGEEKVRSSENFAISQKTETLTASVAENEANVVDLRKTVATDKEATAQAITQVNVKVGENTAAIQETSTAFADTNGKLTTMWSVKMQITANGQYVAAGIGLGIENTGAGLQSQFLVSADRFAIVNSIAGGALTIPFAVEGGQVFVNSLLVKDGSIVNAKIGAFIQSDNFVSGVQGWRLDKLGNLEFNGPAPGGGRLTMTNRAIKVFDQNGVKRVQLGDLDA